MIDRLESEKIYDHEKFKEIVLWYLENIDTFKLNKTREDICLYVLYKNRDFKEKLLEWNEKRESKKKLIGIVKNIVYDKETINELDEGVYKDE